MSRSLIGAKVVVPKIGNVEDYKNKPVVNNGTAIGVIIKCEDTESGYLLKLALWQDVGIETINNRVDALTIGGINNNEFRMFGRFKD